MEISRAMRQGVRLWLEGVQEDLVGNRIVLMEISSGEDV